MENLSDFLNQLNEQNDDTEEKGSVSGINREKAGLSATADFDKMPTNLKKMWREYEQGGGHDYDNVWDFIDDVVGFLRAKKFTGRHIAQWDKKVEKDIAEE